MKIEVDITPAEVRQLFGLPDTTAAQKFMEERFRQFVAQQEEGEGEAVGRMMTAMFEGGRQSVEAYQEFLRGLGGLVAGREERRDG